MKRISCHAVLVIGLFMPALFVHGQVAINTTNTSPNSSAMLDVSSTTKGILIPSMTQEQRAAIEDPATGLLIYQTDFPVGLHFNIGTPESPNWFLVGVNAGPWEREDTNIFFIGGNIGIGTYEPAEKLEIVGGDAIIHGLRVGRGSGYLYENVAFGYQALDSNTTGNYNTAIGPWALHESRSGNKNTAVGAYSMRYHHSADENTAIGFLASGNSLTGSYNLAAGAYALYTNKTDYNTALGYKALYSNRYAKNNIAIGPYALSLQDFSNGNTPFSTMNIAIGYEALLENNPTSTFNGINNVAVGGQAMYSNTTGLNNSAFGYQALYNNLTGRSNIAIGYLALKSNTNRSNLVAIGDSALYANGTGATGILEAQYNTAVGSKSLSSNTTGYSNTALGCNSLYSNTSGNRLVAVGEDALLSNTSGNDNIAVGSGALQINSTGSHNIAIGSDALINNYTSQRNVAIGYQGLRFNRVNDNVCIGYEGLLNNTYASQNIAIGSEALHTMSYANGNASFAGNNIAIGYKALYLNDPTSTSNGIKNVATGYYSLYSNSTGYGNTAYGQETMADNTTGFYNTAIGLAALNDLTTGYYNTAIGYNAGPTSTNPGLNNTTALGNNATVDNHNQVRIGNSLVTSIGGYAGWTTIPSDSKYKTNISESVPGLDFILQLRPVTYNLDLQRLSIDLGEEQEGSINARKASMVFSGFIAQEVEQAAQSAGYDFSGIDAPENENGFYGLRYAEFVVPLVKAVQELSAEVVTLRARNEAMEARLKALETRD